MTGAKTLSSAWHLLAAIYRGRWLATKDEMDFWKNKARHYATRLKIQENGEVN